MVDTMDMWDLMQPTPQWLFRPERLTTMMEEFLMEMEMEMEMEKKEEMPILRSVVTVTVTESDIPDLVEVLSPYAYKWRKIGTQLGFTQHELNNIQCHPMTMVQGPVGYLTAMLSQWVEWTPQDGVHGKYATIGDLWKALRSQTVGLGDDAGRVCLKLYFIVLYEILPRDLDRTAEKISPVDLSQIRLPSFQHHEERRQSRLKDDDSDDDNDEYVTCDESEEQHEQATTKETLFSQMRRGVRKLFGAAKDMTVGLIKGAMRTLNLDVMVTRKYKKRHDKYKGRDVTRWWFEIWGDETELRKMEAQWEREVAAKHKWRLETCPVVSQRN